MKIESSVKDIQIRGYRDPDSDEYDLTINIQIEGDMGLITSLKGEGFYQNFDEIISILTLEYGVTHIFGTMTQRHTKICLRLLGKRYKCKVLRKLENAGRNMFLVMLTRK